MAAPQSRASRNLPQCLALVRKFFFKFRGAGTPWSGMTPTVTVPPPPHPIMTWLLSGMSSRDIGKDTCSHTGLRGCLLLMMGIGLERA